MKKTGFILLLLALLGMVIAPTVQVDWLKEKPDISSYEVPVTGQEITDGILKRVSHQQNWDDGHKQRPLQARLSKKVFRPSNFRPLKQPPGSFG